MCACRRAESSRVLVVPIETAVTVEAAARVFATRPCPAILETARRDRFSRYSILTCDPVRTVESQAGDPDVWESLRRATAAIPAGSVPSGDTPFSGGWIGFLTYEAGLATERIPWRQEGWTGGPLMRFGLYDTAAVYDHAASSWHVVAVEWGDTVLCDRRCARERVAEVRELLERAASAAGESRAAPVAEATSSTASLSPAAYFERFERVRAYIAAGDVYQVNLTVAFSAETDLPPLELYARLRAACPAPYAAYIGWGERAVISSSPELFLSLRNGHVVTRPIKGTRPRSTDPVLDAAYRHGLETSEKDRAELNMIVDLLRNDLGRVCDYGTVRVSDPGEIEAHPNVFHRVATIEGRLRSEATWRELLPATFPGGSITGAPKMRAMQIISELEPEPRGVYCGAIGFLGLDGSAELSLAIRTMTQSGRVVRYHAGSGIVADSVGADEYEEVVAKLTGMRAALYGHHAAGPTPRELATSVPTQEAFVGGGSSGSPAAARTGLAGDEAGSAYPAGTPV